MTRSVKENVERNRFVQAARCERFSVGTEDGMAFLGAYTGGCRLVACDRRPRRQIERPLAATSGHAERCGERADQGKAEK
jgi:hypothetical protein